MSTLLKMQKFHPLCSRCIGMYPLQNRWTVLRYLQCYENFSECCTHLILPETALFSPTPTFAKEPKLFPLSDAERIDRFLTFVMHECGVTVNGLSIGQTMQYYIDGEGNLVTASPDDVANSSGSDSSGSETDGSTAAYTPTGEYCCDFTYTMEGSYRNMKQMLDFVNRVSFLGITAYSFNSVEKQETAAADGTTTGTEDKFQDLYSFTMTITAYMYKSPLETDRDTQTEESTAAAAETPAA